MKFKFFVAGALTGFFIDDMAQGAYWKATVISLLLWAFLAFDFAARRYSQTVEAPK